MPTEHELAEALEKHPCYSEEAHRKYARMHVPVAPRCNIQCNYCNRRFDCCNESRPGVTSEILSPEQAVSKIGYVMERVPNLSVIGIAGPGDPLANEETFRTLALIREKYPGLTLCISTNGLALPANAERLRSLGVGFVTVTVNAADAETGSRIYGSVLWEGKRYTGTEGASILLENQMEGIRRCSDLGMFVKVNIVMIPDVNTDGIPDLVRKVRSLGAYIVNILPLIPVEGTEFRNMRGPTAEERKALMDLCSSDARMMRHCRQCRADAIGLLGEDRSSEFAGCGYGKMDGCGPSGDVPNMISFSAGGYTVAVASDGGKNVDSGFGNARRFLIYSVDGNDVKLLRQTDTGDLNRSMAGASHRDRINSVIGLLDDCDIIAVKEIGDMPRKEAEIRGKRIIITSASVRDAVMSAGSSF